MRHVHHILGAFLLALATSACGGTAEDLDIDSSAESLVATSVAGCHRSPPKKVTTCHIPPGNPANAHEITISERALRAHLAHGDNLGACQVEIPPCISECNDSPDCCELE